MELEPLDRHLRVTRQAAVACCRTPHRIEGPGDRAIRAGTGENGLAGPPGCGDIVGPIEPQAGLEQPLGHIGNSVKVGITSRGEGTGVKPTIWLLLGESPVQILLSSPDVAVLSGTEPELHQGPGRPRVVAV